MMGTAPFDGMDSMFDQMRRSMAAGRLPAIGGSEMNLRMETTDEGYLVHADLPGFRKEGIDLRFDDGHLSIRAVDETERYGVTQSRQIHERMRIPGPVMEADIEASYHNGVLEVRLPTEAEAETGHRIDIE